MGPLGWSIVLSFLMVGAIFMELLTASFGGFTLAALAALGFSVVQAFHYSSSAGFVMTAVNLVLLPCAMVIMLKLFRKSPMRLNAEIKGIAPTPSVRSGADASCGNNKVGKIGTALTDLRPSGLAGFGEDRLDVVADGQFVEKGRQVKVLRDEGIRLVVEPVEEQ